MFPESSFEISKSKSRLSALLSWNSSIIIKSCASRSCFLRLSSSFIARRAKSFMSLNVSSPLLRLASLASVAKLSKSS